MVGTTVRHALSPDHEMTVVTRTEDAIGLVTSGTRVDLILCDLMMPQVTGMEVHERLTRSASDQAERMVFLTGGAFTPTAHAFLDKMPDRVVDKTPNSGPGERVRASYGDARISGGSSRIRTGGQRIKNPLLYQLS